MADHSLIKVESDNNYYCDDCKEKMDGSEKVWICRNCDWKNCHNCKSETIIEIPKYNPTDQI